MRKLLIGVGTLLHNCFWPSGNPHGTISRVIRPRRNQFHKLAGSPYVDETIYALSTAPGKAAIATVRVSGPHCIQIYHSLCPFNPLPKPRKASIRKLLDPVDWKNVVDTAALILHFPAPKTVTGEDVLEFHIHGGHATQKAVLLAISQVASITNLPIRYAEPGEFTKRAFQNDKLDLVQIEALSDTLSAETEQQRRAAVRGNSEKLGKIYDRWREKLLLARGGLEALIDFSEDQNFDETPKHLLDNVTKQVDEILLESSRHEIASQCGERLKRGIRISLLGPPNVGKSSLLNQIVGREASIVSQEAGTTRDIIEVGLDIRGYLCTFADTAGLRIETTAFNCSKIEIGSAEKEGIRRAKVKAINSDIIIVMASIEWSNSSSQWLIIYHEESLTLAAKASNALFVINKCEMAHSSEDLSRLIEDFKSRINVIFSPRMPPSVIPISCRMDKTDDKIKNYQGKIHDLISQVVSIIEGMTELPVEMEDLIGVTERQRLLLISCRTHLQRFKNESDVVLAAENLRLAANCLSRVTGRGESTDVEEVLGVVFEKYHAPYSLCRISY